MTFLLHINFCVDFASHHENAHSFECTAFSLTCRTLRYQHCLPAVTETQDGTNMAISLMAIVHQETQSNHVYARALKMLELLINVRN